MGRLIAAPYVGYLIVNHDYQLALGVFVLAGLTDMVCNKRHVFYLYLFFWFCVGVQLTQKEKSWMDLLPDDIT